MPVGSAIFVLLFYPLLFNLPLNFVRFQWGFRQGLAPMPPEVQEQAEVADRAVLLIMDLTLLAVVVSLLNRSLISVYAVGLTTSNWKSAMAWGALLSYVPLSLGAMLQRIIATDKLAEEPESRGPLAIWCSLTLLGALSVELWRALCIATLIRLELSPWVAVLAVAIAYGAAQLSTSTVRAIGAATFGGAAGFLFVKTGSLLAPITMNLIVAGAQLYRVRHMASRVLSILVALEYSSGSEAEAKALNTRRYVTCPVCSANFHPGKVKRTRRTFTCPDCGEELTYETRLPDYFLFALSFYGVPTLLYFLGFRGFALVLASIGGAILAIFIGKTIYSLFSPPKAEQREGYGGLRLTDKSHHRENHRPTDD